MAPTTEQQEICNAMDRRWLQLQQQTRTIQFKARDAQKEQDLDQLALYQKQIQTIEEELTQIETLMYYYDSIFIFSNIAN